MNKENVNPRGWSNKYWRNHNISDTLKEAVEPDDVNITSIQMHDNLNPLIWSSNWKIKNNIRKSLLINAKRFIEFSDIEGLKFIDIILTGSLANFNYNEKSDLDVHIIMDFKQISNNVNFIGDFFKLKKQLWAEKLNIQIKGYDVELYFQDVSELHHSSGTYSLLKNEWIIKPTKKIINIDSGNIQLKSSHLMNIIDDLENNQTDANFIEKYDKLKDKIKKYRQHGLDNGGEFSVENLVFKVLRNTGYLDKLIKMKNTFLKNELSLDEKN